MMWRTRLCSGQDNSISIYCGNGWYKGRLGYDGASQCYGTRFAAIAELHIWYEDGREDVIATDETWKYRGSDIEMSDIYDGEVLNRQLWKNTENPWKQAELIERDEGTLMGNISLIPSHLTERYSLPVIVKEKLAVQEVIHTPAGETVLDMGQNMVGFMEFESALPQGTKVTLDFEKYCRMEISITIITELQKQDSNTFQMAEKKRFACILLFWDSVMSV